MKVFWLAVGLVLIFEGIGPMLFPNQWREILKSMSQASTHSMRRLGGCFVVAGAVIIYMIWNGS